MPCLHIRNPYTLTPDLAPRVPDLRSVKNIVASCIHRYGRDMPIPQQSRAAAFMTYAKLVMQLHFKPISEAVVPSFEKWLSTSSYSEGRKRQLRQARADLKAFDHAFFKNKSFLKDEVYGKAAQPRSINSYSDSSKAYLGPTMWAIDKAVFKSPWFVKGSDPKTWPERERNLFGNNPVMCTDFSSFEAHHRGVYAELGRFWILHMIRGCGKATFRRVVSQMLLSFNECDYGNVKVTVCETLMSGALWTSSLNGVLNLLLTSYLVGSAKHPELSPEHLAEIMPLFYRGLHEGDDGICSTAPVPEQLIAELGLALKYEYHPHFSQAGFCNVYCLPDGSETITDPRKVLRNFFSLSMKYSKMRESKQMALLKAKAMSILYLYPACPVVSALARRVLVELRGVDETWAVTELTSWHATLHASAKRTKPWLVPTRIEETARVLVESIFGVTVAEQLRVESHLERGNFDIDLSAWAKAEDHWYLKQHLEAKALPHCHFNNPLVMKILHDRALAPSDAGEEAINRCKKARSKLMSIKHIPFLGEFDAPV